jgi:hypothetical protein
MSEDANVLLPTEETAEKLEIEIQSLKDELITKKYLVDADAATIDKYIKFIENKAMWKYSESVGVMQVYADLITARDEGMTNNTKGLMLNNNALEALNYFYSLVSGKGYRDAKNYLDQVKPIIGALTVAKDEHDKVNALEFQLISLREGLANCS